MDAQPQQHNPYPAQTEPGHTNSGIPISSSYLGQMELCHQLAYGYSLDGNASQNEIPKPSRRRSSASTFAIFPAGQFIALDKTTNRVVGLTVSMRVNLDAHDAGQSWAELTNDG